MKIKEIEIPIFFGTLQVVVANNFKKAVKKLKINVGDYEVDNYSAFTYKDKRNNTDLYRVFVTKNVEPSVIVHESVHIANFIFNNTGIQPSLTNDEVQAYLTGWIFEQINKQLKK